MVATGDIQPGQLVISKAGRDKDRAYLLLGKQDESIVYLVDGSLKKLVNPKRKNIKHLQFTGKVATRVREKILTGTKLHNEDIRKVIAELIG